MKREGLSVGIVEKVAKLEKLTAGELDSRADGVILAYSRKMITRRECRMFLDIVNLINGNGE